MHCQLNHGGMELHDCNLDSRRKVGNRSVHYRKHDGDVFGNLDHHRYDGADGVGDFGDYQERVDGDGSEHGDRHRVSGVVVGHCVQ